jgi:rhodanese-related sulfurtransferase
MRLSRFAFWNLLGSALWAGVAIGAGRAFHDQIDTLLRALGQLGGVALALALTALALYIGWRLWRRMRVRRELDRFERVAPTDVVALLARDPHDVVFVDVRAMSPGMPLASRIPGARHLDLGALGAASLEGWPPAGHFITYCACPNDASAVRAAQWLQGQGRPARVLRGGIEAWTQAGLALETA